MNSNQRMHGKNISRNQHQAKQPAMQKQGQKVAVQKVKKTDKGLVISFTKLR